MIVIDAEKIVVDGEEITPAECEALWLDWGAGRRTDELAAERGCGLRHISALIFAGKRIATGEVK